MLLPKIMPAGDLLHSAVPHLYRRRGVSVRKLPSQRNQGAAPSLELASDAPWVSLGGVPVKLMDAEGALREMLDRAGSPEAPPLGVCSANLDHIRHFGTGSRWIGTLDQPAPVEWLTLIDGAPLATEARRITSKTWPRLAGSDLIHPFLTGAAARGLRVGFLGGSEETQKMIAGKFATERPELTVVGWWAPARSTLGDAAASRQLAEEIRAAAPEVLVVGLGKPRQELWIAEYGHLTGAKVLLAFGAVVDFLAGNVRRAPQWASSHSLEWAWRLMLEPRRLARRYLVEGPEAYVKLRTSSRNGIEQRLQEQSPEYGVPEPGPSRAPGSFAPVAERADVAVVVVTYNNAEDVGPLVASLRKEAHNVSIKVVVADNSPDERTLLELAHHPDITAVRTGGNLGYAGGINAAMALAGDAGSYLILNPDLRVEPGAVAAMLKRMNAQGAGVVVPVLLDDDGTIYPSLRREPGVLRALGDAALGSYVKGRPGWLSEMDFDPESYVHGHRVDWATGAALLISSAAAEAVGAWDERFFLYSEETDYCHRVRDAGFSIWFEPAARMWHERGGSGSSPALVALMSVNRVRYADKYLGRGRALAFRGVVLAAEVARLNKAGHRDAALAVLSQRRWEALPHATRTATAVTP
ncbi:WecB/TagA/CpsF family glycosyltransferase [Paenarthrobacter aurescens]|nr:WecB/TagA/CpsF family glycosyltransferase [Paenarthrobacter aurescens]MDO6143609.1 WecB/TagA/CpsF family glycosyltransferase [Paenarthrobacter aurescens]MDO6147457.1 WecB/TagA/CpsF family glycosyltransferase [Paenarthrobacter aurescens]MDO6158701.1 WecB/TagA/CpsF family glycosyltransferase [Paenarthrobacter aurescens]MDO6162684.1 WecB/TagA/CpsF family glycosyltransferase [Paenarthrobacter aurescens]